MKNRLILAVLCIVLFCIYSCHKDSQPLPPSGPEPVKPDLTVKINSSLSGYVINESDSPVVFAAVVAGNQQTTTDKYGYFSFSGVSLPKTAALVKVSSGGYFNGYRTFSPQENKSSFVRIRLLTKKEAGIVDAASGGQVTTIEGGGITLPASGVVTASDGFAYMGPVHISAAWIDPAEGNDQQPGDSRGVDSTGFLKGLRGYGTMAVELTGSGGQLLQIAPGKTAGIRIPISSRVANTAPSTIALWSFNDSTGLWKQEGSATRSGNTFAGSTSHFSFWEDAEGIPIVNFKVKVLDASSNPLVHVPVSVTPASMPQNAGYGRFGYTDADGFISGVVMTNSSLVLQVLTPCAVTAYSHPFTTTAADIDLGAVTGNMGQAEVTIRGTATNCTGQPITNGYVQTYDHGFYNRIPIASGSFTFTGLACTNLPVNIVVIDNGAGQQGTPKTVTLAPGVNDLGALSACGVSTMGSLTFTLTDVKDPMHVVTKTITEPQDTIAGYFFPSPDNPANKSTQIVTLSGSPNLSQQMAFQFDGDAAVGSAHTMTEIFSNAFTSGRGYWPVKIPVNITEYGPIGGFISGSFSGNMIEFDNSLVYTFTCTFRVRRYN